MSGGRFVVKGDPVQQGSLSGYTVPKGDGTVGVRLKHSNERALKAWRDTVAWGAKAGGVKCIVSGPVTLAVVFYLERPKGDFGTGKNAGVLKDSARTRPFVRPDWDKLVRALCDGLTGVAYKDDAQVVTATVLKRYAGTEGPRAVVVVKPTPPEEA